MSLIPYKIDVHHHIIPPQLEGVSHGAKELKVPERSVAEHREYCESLGIRTAIFSVSFPGVLHIPDPEESAAAARSINEYCASRRDTDPSSYGFFATLPSLEHTDLVLREIRHAFDSLFADGVTLFTSYATADGYLGHSRFLPVWKELNSRGAIVFIHPNSNKDAAMPFNKNLPPPVFDWPHETGRTAMDLIMNKRLQQFSNVKIILSHAGGTLPALARRTTVLSSPEFGERITAQDIMDQAQSFYFDLALSGSQELLPLILGFAKKGHVLFGSDAPQAPVSICRGLTRFIDDFPMSFETREEVYHGAALHLLPRLKGLE